MALTAADIVDDVRGILIDDDFTEWTDQDLLGFV
jgi:hypothetical protein